MLQVQSSTIPVRVIITCSQQVGAGLATSSANQQLRISSWLRGCHVSRWAAGASNQRGARVSVVVSKLCRMHVVACLHLWLTGERGPESVPKLCAA